MHRHDDADGVHILIGWLKVLSEKLIMEERMKSICKKDRTVFRRGMGFDGITVLNPGFCGSMLCGPVTFWGHTDQNEMLFSSGNGRYYFTVRDGWGVMDNHLYALSIGSIVGIFKGQLRLRT